MKQFQIQYDNRITFERKLAEIREACKGTQEEAFLFYLTWTENALADLDTVTGEIETSFPGAVFYGNEASGNISMGEFTLGIHVTCYVFESAQSKAELVWVEKGTAVSSLDDLWKYCSAKKNLRAVELIPSMAYVEELGLDGSVPDVGKDVLIFGGASVNYDNATYDADIIAKGHPRTRKGMAVLLYFGSELRFASDVILGWKGLGRTMEVTDSTGKCIREIDNAPAYSVYEKYLNLSMEDKDTLVFPLIVEEDGNEYIRTPQIIMPDKSMQMFATVPAGTKIRISYGDKNTILSSIYENAKKIAAFRPQIIRAYSCAARRLFWGDGEVGKETRILEEITPVCGFYTGGEILRFGDKLRVMNQTLSVVSVRESDAAENLPEAKISEKAPDTSLVSRLAYFTEKVTEEREREHRRLQQNSNIISCLASEYYALYYFNIEEGTFEIYTLDDQKLPEAAKIVRTNNDPLAVFRNYGMSGLVHPEDKHLFAELTVDKLQERLMHSKSFSVRFRRDFAGEYLWSSMDVIKYEDVDEPPKAIAVGFAERDAEIRSEETLQNCLRILEKSETTDESINELLKMVGEFYAADRAYVFELDDNFRTAGNTYEWCAEGVQAMISQLQNMPYENTVGWIKEFERQGAFYMETFDSPFNIEPLVESLKVQGIESLIAAPIMAQDRIVGFIGVDNPAKGKKQIRVLTSAATVAYSEILKRKEAEMSLFETAKIFSDTFLESYISAYYINLEDRSQVVFRRDEFIQNEYGHIENYYESICKYVNECVHPDDREMMRKVSDPDYIREQLRNANGYSVYMRDISGQKTRWFRFDVTRGIDENHVGLSFSDVTENREKDEQNRRQLMDAVEAADAANKSKTNFLFNMSHDIRTPMNAITGFTTMAKKYIGDSDRVTEYLDKIDMSGQQLLLLVNQVLEMARIESGKTELDEKPLNVINEFNSMITVLTEQAKANGLEFHHSISDVVHPNVLADAARISSVILNVTGNAMKYTPEGGSVSMTLREIPARKPECASFVLTVEDTGIGMSEEFQKILFDPFTRESTSTVSKIQGTGLGMSIVKELINLMGGDIDVHSKQGEGTRFDITLDLKQNEQTGEGAGTSPLPRAVSLEGRKVLLVEDNELNREIAVDILLDEDLVVESAEDGTVAVNLLKEKGPSYYDFILMDIQMPVMGGYEATREIRKMYPEAEIPIIALSANAFAEDKAASLAAGMDDHVSKPINVGELLGALTRFLK